MIAFCHKFGTVLLLKHQLNSLCRTCISFSFLITSLGILSKPAAFLFLALAIATWTSTLLIGLFGSLFVSTVCSISNNSSAM